MGLSLKHRLLTEQTQKHIWLSKFYPNETKQNNKIKHPDHKANPVYSIFPTFFASQDKKICSKALVLFLSVHVQFQITLTLN